MVYDEVEWINMYYSALFCIISCHTVLFSVIVWYCIVIIVLNFQNYPVPLITAMSLFSMFHFPFSTFHFHTPLRVRKYPHPNTPEFHVPPSRLIWIRIPKNPLISPHLSRLRLRLWPFFFFFSTFIITLYNTKSSSCSNLVLFND